MLLMNKLDQNRPLDARPGHDPFGGTDPTYSCDTCTRTRRASASRPTASSTAPAGRRWSSRAPPRHNELLGGHGDDTIHAGPWGDVIWGDYKPSGQPTSQVDRIWGGDGRDFIYASHGWNVIARGGGPDLIKAHFGHGSIDCGGGARPVHQPQEPSAL